MPSTIKLESQQLDVLGLLKRAVDGDQRSLVEFIELCLPQIKSYLVNRGASEPEALANLVINEFLQGAPRLAFSYPEQMWSYVYRIARSRLVDQRRKASREISSQHTESADIEIASFDGGLVDTLWVDGLLSGLTDDQREIIHYRFWDDLTIEDTARRTGKSDAAVKALQRRALAALAAALAVAAAVILVLSNAGSTPNRIQSSDPANRPEAPLRSTGMQGELPLQERQRLEVITDEMRDQGLSDRPNDNTQPVNGAAPPTSLRTAGHEPTVPVETTITTDPDRLQDQGPPTIPDLAHVVEQTTTTENSTTIANTTPRGADGVPGLPGADGGAG